MPLAMGKPSSQNSPEPTLGFEAALAELEAIVRNMEAGQLPLDQALATYERGATLLRHCQETLGAAEQKLKILENGELRGFDAEVADNTTDGLLQDE